MQHADLSRGSLAESAGLSRMSLAESTHLDLRKNGPDYHRSLECLDHALALRLAGHSVDN